MSKKPKDHVTLFIGWGAGQIYFEDIDSFEEIPYSAQDEKTRREFEAFKKWERECSASGSR